MNRLLHALRRQLSREPAPRPVTFASDGGNFLDPLEVFIAKLKQGGVVRLRIRPRGEDAGVDPKRVADDSDE
jgi:hypothetical protein